MGKLARRKKTVSSGISTQDIPYFQQTPELSARIASPFLSQRVAAYIEAAQALIEELDLSSPESLPPILSFFGKQARRLDLILAVAGSSGSLPMPDKILAQKIRLSVENRLAQLAQISETGILHIETAEGPIETGLHSSAGRKLAALFARWVPATSDQPQSDILRASFLPEQLHAKIDKNLATAETAYKNGDWPQAETAYKEILKTDRQNPAALRRLGKIYLVQGMSGAAISHLRQALHFFPGDPELLSDMGAACFENNDFGQALKFYDQAVRAAPGNSDPLIGLAMTHLVAGNDADAKKLLDRAEKMAPQKADILSRLGVFHEFHHDIEKAGSYFARALKLDPNHGFTLLNYATLLNRQQKRAEAIAMVDRALKLVPNRPNYLHVKSMMLLGSGDYREGWALHEKRLLQASYIRTYPALAPIRPIWRGEKAPGKRLLLIGEQGLGDILQFVRYAALCKARVGKVYVLCPQNLVGLLKNCPSIDGAFTTLPKWRFDLQVGMMSLPHIFATTLETVPAQTPYLFALEKGQVKWAKRLALPAGKVKIGLVWSGSMFVNATRGDLRAKRRNISLRQLLPLFDIENTAFCSLQFGDTAGEIDELGLRSRFIDVMKDVRDMQDTACIIANLDLVISVDTSVAHLAGALGKPIWILSRFDACWRWLGNRPDSPWYPSARIFGQPKSGDWDSVVGDVAAALEAYAARRK